MIATVWAGMGFPRWPLAFSLLAVLLLSAWTTTRLFRPSASADLGTKAWLDAILFWGGFGVITGLLGTVIGIIIAAQFLEANSDVSATLLWGGIKVSLLSTAAGFVILAISAISWFTLQMRWRLLFAREVEEA